MLTRYQNGCLQKVKRKDGIERWQFRWQQRGADGKIRERKKTFGLVRDYPEKSKKLQDKMAALRLAVNTDGPTELTSTGVAAVIQHYIDHELDPSQRRRAYSTCKRKKLVLLNWVLPQWGKYRMQDVKAVAVEKWLDSLVTHKFKKKSKKPKPLAGGTKEKIRDAMSNLFNHAIRWEFTDKNPIIGVVKGSGVRVSGKREREPDVLEVGELQALLAGVSVRERAMLSIDMVSGLRRGELAGLKWADFDFSQLSVSVTRSLVDQQVGDCKTEVSRKLMPLDPYTAEDVRAWYRQTRYQAPEDWVWATDAARAGEKRGKQPVWLATVMRCHIQPLAKKLGIHKQIGWHTFRHTFATLLKANKEDVKVVQELLRHSTSRMSMDVYAQALAADKREAQSKVVTMIRPKTTCTVVVPRVSEQIGVSR
jgi:integrase